MSIFLRAYSSPGFVDPVARIVNVYTATPLEAEQTLDGGAVLARFPQPPPELFAELERRGFA